MTPAIDLPPATAKPWAPAIAELPTASMYARFWKFVLHHWQHHADDDNDSTTTASVKRRRPFPKSPTTEMRVRVRMLHELEALSPQTTASTSVKHAHRTHRHRQALCGNCGQRYFRDQGTQSAATQCTEYCSLDCRSSHEYRADVQRAVDTHDAFGTVTSPTTSTSRL